MRKNKGMSMKKQMVLAGTALALSATSLMPTYAAWDRDAKGYWYLFDTGSYARSQIIAIDGVNYAFDQNAYMVEGWYQDANSNWYYFAPQSGAQVYGWLQLNGIWYYLNPNEGGKMKTSWLELGQNLYYFDASGAMKTGTFVVDGCYYYAEADGSIRRNRIEKEGSIMIKYDETGKQWYRNEENVQNGKSGGEYWQPLLENTALTEQRAEVQESVQEYVEELKEKLYKQYKEEMDTAYSANARIRRGNKWKEKAIKKLQEFSTAISEDEINAYVQAVLNGTYKNGVVYDSEYEFYFGDYDYDYDYDSNYDSDDEWEEE